MITAIEEGVDTEGIEIIQNSAEIQKIIFSLIKSAAEEILVVFSSANAFHRQEYLGALQFLKESTNERGINVRILTPCEDSSKMEGTTARSTVTKSAETKYPLH